jgi:hypothetical protein
MDLSPYHARVRETQAKYELTRNTGTSTPADIRRASAARDEAVALLEQAKIKGVRDPAPVKPIPPQVKR